MESYPDQMTVEAARVYARDLAEIGIQIDHKPLAFGQILGKVYGRKEVVTAMMGFGSPEERLDPDFYLRAIYSTGGAFNAPHYSNPEFDKLIDEEQRTGDHKKRIAILHQAGRILMEDVPFAPLYTLAERTPPRRPATRRSPGCCPRGTASAG